MTTNQLPDNVLQALESGHVIEAIKLLREATGLGLKEAKDLVDEHMRGNTVRIVTAEHAGPLPASVEQAIRQGNKIEAIKLLCAETGLGLKEAKDAVEASMGQPSASTGMGISSGGSRVGSILLWVAALVLIALVVYYVRNKSAPADTPVVAPPPIAEVAKPVVLPLSKERLSALPSLSTTSAMVLGEAPDIMYNWRFGPNADALQIWARIDPAWSDAELASVMVTSGYTIESDLGPQFDLVAEVLGMDRAEVEKKITPTREFGGHQVKIFDQGDFTANGLFVHFSFEDDSGVNGHTKPHLLVSISPEPYRDFAIERAKKQGDSTP